MQGIKKSRSYGYLSFHSSYFIAYYAELLVKRQFTYIANLQWFGVPVMVVG